MGKLTVAKQGFTLINRQTYERNTGLLELLVGAQTGFIGPTIL